MPGNLGLCFSFGFRGLGFRVLWHLGALSVYDCGLEHGFVGSNVARHQLALRSTRSFIITLGSVCCFNGFP